MLRFAFPMLIAALLIYGYVAEREARNAGLPRDFYLSYSFGSCNRSFGWSQVEVWGSGNVRIIHTSASSRTEKALSLSQNAIRGLYLTIAAQDIKSLQPEYISPNVIGGMCKVLLVRELGESTNVSIANMPVPSVAKIEEHLFGLLDNAQPDWYKG